MASAGTQFPGQQSHEGKPRPLAEAKRLQQLPLGMLKGGRNRVHGGEWQARTSGYK
jgi:hypothetical protein